MDLWQWLAADRFSITQAAGYTLGLWAAHYWHSRRPGRTRTVHLYRDQSLDVLVHGPAGTVHQHLDHRDGDT